jgi:Protein of unknown function (DUF3237)
MELVHEFTFTAVLNDAVPVGEGPFGNRRIREVLSGEVTGERIRGTVGSGGADWVLVGPDGHGRLDVRLTIHTHDGAHIYVQYFGVIEYTEAALAATGASARATTTSTTSARPRVSRPEIRATTG